MTENQKVYLQYIIIAVLLTILFSILPSCASMKEKRRQRICATCPQEYRMDSIYLEKVTEKFRDTTIVIPADSSWYKALIECIDGKPVIRKESQKDGNRSGLNVSIDKDGNLSVKSYCDSLEQELQLRDRIIERLNSVNKKSTIVVQPKKRFGNDFFYYTGMVTCLSIFLFCIILLLTIFQGKPVKWLGIKRDVI